MGVASLVLGIVSLVASLLGLYPIGLICGIVGIILAVVAKKNNPTGTATAGLVLSIIGLVLSALVFVACAMCLGSTGLLGSML